MLLEWRSEYIPTSESELKIAGRQRRWDEEEERMAKKVVGAPGKKSKMHVGDWWFLSSE